MKTKLYILLFVLASSVAFTSCADEEVSPKTETTGNTGGNGQQDPIKG